MIDNILDFDIDQELEEIIVKYDLDRHYPAYRTSRQACAYIREWIETISEQDTKFLFITMNDSVYYMIREWATGENISAILIFSVEEMENHISELQNADKVYVVAYTRTVEILHWLWRHDFQAESVYDVLENQHIYCQMEFYRFFPPFIMSDELELNDRIGESNIDGVALTLYEYHYQKQRLQRSLSEDDRRRLNEKLFFLAIHMRNFIEAERILNTMDCSEEYEKCWQEIEALLNRIKSLLAQKKQNHIIIYWLDALSFENAEKMDYLQEQRSHSLYFHNAYTLTPNTYPTFKTILFGIRQVDDLGYQIKSIGLDNSPLLRDAMEQGYDYKIMSNYMNRRLEPKDSYDYYGRQIVNAPCSEVFWNLTRQILQSRQPTIYLVHALVELHQPHLSVRRDKFEKEYELTPETWQAQYDELNGQLRFYDRMIGTDSYRIYMGDHGATGMIINRMHVCFQIYHASWENKEVEKLFCYLDFDKIIHRLLTGEDIDDTTWDREYVPIQDVDYYNSALLKAHLIRKAVDIRVLPSLTSYKGVITSEYVYVRFKTGDEIFHRWSDGECREIIDLNNYEKNSEFIKELRKKAGVFPEELDTDAQFVYAKNTYVVYENIKRTIRGAADLLNEKITGGGYAEGSIVLRPGGFHTMRLYEILSEDNRKKIGGILDRNADCICKDLGYPIYHLDDKLPNNIQAILLSTYENLEELKYETQKIYSGLEIIDIYQYWKELGYSFSKNFWCGLESDWDIEFLKE